MNKNEFSSFLFFAALILVCGAVIYSNTLHAPFYFDDQHIILNNPRISRGWDWIDAFNDAPTRSLSSFSFTMNYNLGGFSSFGYHLVNIFIHLLNGILIFVTTRLLLTTPKVEKASPFPASKNLAALSAALIFICHPVQTQAVTYIVQRLTSMASLAYLLTLLFYLYFRKSGNKTFYLLGLLAALSGVLSKEIVFTLPAALCLCEVLFFEQDRSTIPRLIKRLLPFFLISLLIPGLFFLNHQNLILDGGQIGLIPSVTKNISRGTYFITQLDVIRTYIRLLVLPVRQTFDYDFPLSTGFFSLTTFSSFILIMLVLALGCYLVRRQPLASFGIFFFFLSLSVESSIIPIPDLIFEHRLYLPMAGFSFLTASCMGQVLRSSRIFAIILIGLTMILGTLTYKRNAIWTDDLTFWQDQTQKAPSKGRGHFCLGEVYYRRGQYLLAAESFLKALLRTSPKARSDVYFNNLGSAYSGLGQIRQSEYWYRKGLENHPKSGVLNTNLAILKRNEGDLATAVLLLKKAILFSPETPIAYYELAQIHVMEREYWLAIPLLEKAIALDGSLSLAHKLLSKLYGLQRSGKIDEITPDTLRSLQNAVRSAPLNPLYHVRLGEFYRRSGQEKAAVGSFRKAISIAPSYEEAYNALALLYAEKGERQKASAVLVEYLQQKKKRKPLFGS